MANGTPLGGPATGLEGPLGQMWRSVSRNITDAAEARLAARLEDHVHQAHGRRALTIVVEGAPAPAEGGTGNTTMSTQTTAPTGAENSLWFNPSETA